MSWGHQIEYLEALRDDLGVQPKGLASRPDPHPLGALLHSAFNTLSSSRGYGMGGPMPISIAEMWAYCQMFAVDTLDDREQFVRTLQKLDHEYLEIVAKRNATNSKTEVVNDGPALDNPRKG